MDWQWPVHCAVVFVVVFEGNRFKTIWLLSHDIPATRNRGSRETGVKGRGNTSPPFRGRSRPRGLQKAAILGFLIHEERVVN